MIPDAIFLCYLPKLHYPNYLSISFVTKGWKLFLCEESYNLSVLLGLVFLWHYLVAGFVWCDVATHVAAVIGARRYLAGGLCSSTKRLDGQTVIVTGSNTGIGKETARDLLRRGARVILACRNITKAKAACNELRKVSLKVEVRQLDLSNLHSVRSFAKGIIKDNIRVHILINNAGMVTESYSETSEGFELQMVTNHLGHFLLTNLLLPQMKHGEPARIINVSSCLHHIGRINFEDFNDKANFEGFRGYNNSKLANILFTRHLSKILRGSNIEVFSAHPGVVYSDIGDAILSTGLQAYLYCLLVKTTMEGAQTTIHCATEAKQHPEMYFSDCSIGWASPDSKDGVLAAKLWRLSARLVKLD